MGFLVGFGLLVLIAIFSALLIEIIEMKHQVRQISGEISSLRGALEGYLLTAPAIQKVMANRVHDIGVSLGTIEKPDDSWMDAFTIHGKKVG